MAAPVPYTSEVSAPASTDGSLRLRVLDDPFGRADFRDFRCGDDSLRHWVGKRFGKTAAFRPKQQAVLEVHEIANNLYRRRAHPQVVIALELLGKLVGFCGIRRHPYAGTYPITAEYYINVLGRNQAFTGFRPEAGLTSGFVLLRGALEQIAVWSEVAQAVWALVWEDNEHSRPLFAAHRFETFAPEGPRCQTVQFRPAGLGVPRGTIMLENPRMSAPVSS